MGEYAPKASSVQQPEHREAVAFSKVRAFMHDVLGIENLDHLLSITIDRDGVTIEVHALNAQGHMFSNGGAPAIDRLRFPMDWSA